MFPVGRPPTWTSSTPFCFSMAGEDCAVVVAAAAAAAVVVAVVVVAVVAGVVRRRFGRPLKIRWSGRAGRMAPCRRRPAPPGRRAPPMRLTGPAARWQR